MAGRGPAPKDPVALLNSLKNSIFGGNGWRGTSPDVGPLEGRNALSVGWSG